MFTACKQIEPEGNGYYYIPDGRHTPVSARASAALLRAGPKFETPVVRRRRVFCPLLHPVQPLGGRREFEGRGRASESLAAPLHRRLTPVLPNHRIEVLRLPQMINRDGDQFLDGDAWPARVPLPIALRLTLEGPEVAKLS